MLTSFMAYNTINGEYAIVDEGTYSVEYAIEKTINKLWLNLSVMEKLHSHYFRI